MNAIEQQIDELFRGSDPATTREISAAVIAEGQRNAFLASLAGVMRRRDISVEAIAAALVVENTRRCSPPLPDAEVQAIARSIGRYAASGSPSVPPALVGFTLDKLLTHTFPERKPIFLREDCVVLRAGHLAEIYAERGIGKTWFTLSLAMAAAAGTEALGFRASAPCRVLDIDGEMASQDLQERAGLLCERLGIPRTTTSLTLLGADWQEQFMPRLDTESGQAAVEPFVEAADLIFLDNRSSLLDPEGEKDPTAWQPAQDWLLSLRRRGKATVVAHHSNRMGGARGHSKPEDAMDLLIKLARPEGYSQEEGARFQVTFEKSRGAYGPGVAPFEARLTSTGWTTTYGRQDSIAGKLREYVRLAGLAKERPTSASAAIRGAKVQKAEGLKVWGELLQRGEIAKRPDGFALREDHYEA
jgi:putative DNA primase/helicase